MGWISAPQNSWNPCFFQVRPSACGNHKILPSSRGWEGCPVWDCKWQLSTFTEWKYVVCKETELSQRRKTAITCKGAQAEKGIRSKGMKSGIWHHWDCKIRQTNSGNGENWALQSQSLSVLSSIFLRAMFPHLGDSISNSLNAERMDREGECWHYSCLQAVGFSHICLGRSAWRLCLLYLHQSWCFGDFFMRAKEWDHPADTFHRVSWALNLNIFHPSFSC